MNLTKGCALLFLAAVAIFAVPSRCTAQTNDDDATNLIVGGFKVNVEEVPYQIALFRDDWFVCGGSIIGPFWILTAQHCIPDTNASRYEVVVGADQPMLGQRLTVAEVFQAPAELFDVSLLKLDKSLQYNPQVACIALMTDKEPPNAGTPAQISGYGLTTKRSGETQLRAATVGVMSHEKCIEYYQSEYEKVRPHQFCAGFEGGQVDSCQGDSGGPLVVHGLLTGVTSWGLGCARANDPGVYVFVGAFTDWLQQIVKEQTTTQEQKLCSPPDQ